MTKIIKNKQKTQNKSQNKKADITMTTIIIAALALLVLIVLVIIFSGRMNLFQNAYDQNTDSRTMCITKIGCKCTSQCDNGGVQGAFKDCGPGEVCCCRTGI